MNLFQVQSDGAVSSSYGRKTVNRELNIDVFERRTSTGSEPFSIFICLDANKFVLLPFVSLIKTIYPRV